MNVIFKAPRKKRKQWEAASRIQMSPASSFFFLVKAQPLELKSQGRTTIFGCNYSQRRSAFLQRGHGLYITLAVILHS